MGVRFLAQESNRKNPDTVPVGARKKIKKSRGKTKFIIVLSCILGTLVLLCGGAFGYAYHTPDGILPGVSVCGAEVGGQSAEAAVGLVTDMFQNALSGKSVTYTYGTHREEISTDALAAELLVAETVQSAEAYGKNGNVLKRLSEKWKARRGNADLPLLFSVDEEAIKETTRAFREDLDHPAVENDNYLDTEQSAIIITNGTQGEVFDASDAAKKLQNALGYLTFEPIELLKIEQDTEYLSVKKLKEAYEREPENASYEIVGYAVAYTPEIPGVTIDDETAQSILEAHRAEGEEFSVPVRLNEPEITVEGLEDELFGTRLSTYTTRFNTGDVGRSKNVALAAEKINGTVLAAGATFSYNEIVGERTSEQGFQIAKVYSGGKAVDGIGGGICQVSTTLYNAVLYANLEVVSRRNHQLPVSYVPLGQDATVVYGSTDFKFRNSQKTPIKITSSTYQGELTVSIYGAKPEKKVEVTLTNHTVSTIPYKTEKKTDASLPYGTTRTEQSGKVGYRVETYMKVTEDGAVVKDGRITVSTYNPRDEIIIVSGASAPSASPEPSAGGKASSDPSAAPASASAPEKPSAVPAEEPLSVSEDTGEEPDRE